MTTSPRTPITSWETAFASTSSFVPKVACGSPPQWRDASSSGTTMRCRPPACSRRPRLRAGVRRRAAGHRAAERCRLALAPRAEAALRQELQRLADAAKRARQGQSSSSSSDERLARAVTAASSREQCRRAQGRILHYLVVETARAARALSPNSRIIVVSAWALLPLR
jgi:hypothetical protein